MVVRPYYWFADNFTWPVRAVKPYDSQKDRVVSILDGSREVKKFFESVGQLSGLVYRKSLVRLGFSPETFTAHIYPLAEITKHHRIVFLKDYTVAVRIASSQTRFKKSIYDISPTGSWVKTLNLVYREKRFQKVKEAAIDQISTHFVGLVQLKNYSTMRNLIREIFY